MQEQLWKDVVTLMVNAGQIPIPVSETLMEIARTLLTEEQAEFIQIFTKPLNMDEIMENSTLDAHKIESLLQELMSNGVITGISSKSTQTIVYRLMPPLPGIFEFTLMRGETGEKEQKLATLFDKMFGELAEITQGSYDTVIDLFKTATPVTRVVPVQTKIDQKNENIIPYEDVGKIVDKFDTIAVAHCYCRHEKSLLGKSCEITAEKENCLFFGQTAKFVVDYKFGRQISKNEAKKILQASEEAGLVHKSFHNKQDIQKDEFAICNCCMCCCGTFELFYRGAAPTHTFTSHIAEPDLEACEECGLCADRCPMEAITLRDEKPDIDEHRCIGCGVCAYHCPSEAIALKRTGQREVFVPPPIIDVAATMTVNQ